MTNPTNGDRIDALDVESRIIDLCQKHPKGITDAFLQSALPNIETLQRVTAFNRLLSRGKIELLKQGNEVKYRLKDADAAINVKGVDVEEKLVYQIIKSAGNKGIWIRDIRIKSNLNQTVQVNKILKNLESKKAIKAVNCVNQSKHKVYMLYDVQPDISVTGGIFWSKHDFDAEFVKVLNEQCLQFLKNKIIAAQTKTQNPILQQSLASASAKEILDYITKLGISKDPLSLQDIESILNTLLFDGNAVKSTQFELASSNEGVGETVYRAAERLVEPSGLIRTPCGGCPLIRECSPDGIISPKNCPHLKDWLSY